MTGIVSYAGNGLFTVSMNGKTQTLNMADLNAMLRMEQVGGLDQTIADQLSDIRNTNIKRKALNQLLQHMRKFKTEKKDDDDRSGVNRPEGKRPERGDAEWQSAYDTHYKNSADFDDLKESERPKYATGKANMWIDGRQATYDRDMKEYNDNNVTLDGIEGSKDIAGWMKHFGITRTDVKNGSSSAWDANIAAAKSAIDNVTSDSEMQMLRFRQMVDKRGTALQEAKTTLSNDKRLKDAIVQG